MSHLEHCRRRRRARSRSLNYASELSRQLGYGNDRRLPNPSDFDQTDAHLPSIHARRPRPTRWLQRARADGAVQWLLVPGHADGIFAPHKPIPLSSVRKVFGNQMEAQADVRVGRGAEPDTWFNRMPPDIHRWGIVAGAEDHLARLRRRPLIKRFVLECFAKPDPVDADGCSSSERIMRCHPPACNGARNRQAVPTPLVIAGGLPLAIRIRFDCRIAYIRGSIFWGGKWDRRPVPTDLFRRRSGRAMF